MDQICDEILSSRERRQYEIEKMKTQYKTVITVKTNIPGEHKNLPVSYLLVHWIHRLVPRDMIDEITFYDGPDGPYYLIGSNTESTFVKRTLVAIENTHPLGRYIDLDVYGDAGRLSRGQLRSCILCDKPAFVCIREGNHSLQQLLTQITKDVQTYFNQVIIDMADDSIMQELNLHPKFGLVTPRTSGSHEDMDYALMKKAKEAILPYFGMMFECGWTENDLFLIFDHCRTIGLQAEEAMMKATEGVNAYKGLIFNMGAVVTISGYILGHHINPEELFGLVQALTKPVLNDFALNMHTSGMDAYHQHGLLGARGELTKGMPTVKKALAYMHEDSGHSLSEVLMYLIVHSEDTVLLKRAGSMRVYHQVKSMFKDALKNPAAAMDSLNDFCLSHHLSFGGSADLLILVSYIRNFFDTFR